MASNIDNINQIGLTAIGRPRNNIESCKDCGTTLTFDNTRETRKGSGSLRSICKECERERDRAKYAETRKVKKFRKRVSTGPLFSERPNRVGMAAQTAVMGHIHYGINGIICDLCGKDHWLMIYRDALCEECGGIIRYDTHLDRVCEKCGLVGEPVIYDAPNSEFTGRQLKSYEKSRYNLTIEVNRDKIIDIQRSENSRVVPDGNYEPTISGGTYDPTYAHWYSFRRK